MAFREALGFAAHSAGQLLVHQCPGRLPSQTGPNLRPLPLPWLMLPCLVLALPARQSITRLRSAGIAVGRGATAACGHRYQPVCNWLSAQWLVNSRRHDVTASESCPSTGPSSPLCRALCRAPSIQLNIRPCMRPQMCHHGSLHMTLRQFSPAPQLHSSPASLHTHGRVPMPCVACMCIGVYGMVRWCGCLCPPYFLFVQISHSSLTAISFKAIKNSKCQSSRPAAWASAISRMGIINLPHGHRR